MADCPTCHGSVRILLTNLSSAWLATEQSAPSQLANDLAGKFLDEWQDDGRDFQTKLAIALDLVGVDRRESVDSISVRRVGWAEAIRYLRNIANKRGFASAGRYADVLDRDWPRPGIQDGLGDHQKYQKSLPVEWGTLSGDAPRPLIK